MPAGRASNGDYLVDANRLCITGGLGDECVLGLHVRTQADGALVAASSDGGGGISWTRAHGGSMALFTIEGTTRTDHVVGQADGTVRLPSPSRVSIGARTMAQRLADTAHLPESATLAGVPLVSTLNMLGEAVAVRARANDAVLTGAVDASDATSIDLPADTRIAGTPLMGAIVDHVSTGSTLADVMLTGEVDVSGATSVTLPDASLVTIGAESFEAAVRTMLHRIAVLEGMTLQDATVTGTLDAGDATVSLPSASAITFAGVTLRSLLDGMARVSLERSNDGTQLVAARTDTIVRYPHATDLADASASVVSLAYADATGDFTNVGTGPVSVVVEYEHSVRGAHRFVYACVLKNATERLGAMSTNTTVESQCTGRATFMLGVGERFGVLACANSDVLLGSGQMRTRIIVSVATASAEALGELATDLATRAEVLEALALKADAADATLTGTVDASEATSVLLPEASRVLIGGVPLSAFAPIAVSRAIVLHPAASPTAPTGAIRIAFTEPIASTRIYGSAHFASTAVTSARIVSSPPSASECEIAIEGVDATALDTAFYVRLVDANGALVLEGAYRYQGASAPGNADGVAYVRTL